jgi:hypothetical protein
MNNEHLENRITLDDKGDATYHRFRCAIAMCYLLAEWLPIFIVIIVSEIHELWSSYEQPLHSSSSLMEQRPQDDITTAQDLLNQLEEVGLIF